MVADIAQKIAGQGASQNLGVLEKAPGLKSWTPTDPGHYWDGRLGTGAGLPVDQAVILRPALPSPPSDEYSRFYIEDGSGRITQLV